jgi:hypothetical protein
MSSMLSGAGTLATVHSACSGQRYATMEKQSSSMRAAVSIWAPDHLPSAVSLVDLNGGGPFPFPPPIALHNAP